MLLKHNKKSNTGQNISFLIEKYKFSELDELLMSKNLIKFTRVYDLPKEEEWKPKIIEELCLMKMNLLESAIEEDEIDFLLDEISSK